MEYVRVEEKIIGLERNEVFDGDIVVLEIDFKEVVVEGLDI